MEVLLVQDEFLVEEATLYGTIGCASLSVHLNIVACCTSMKPAQFSLRF